MWALFDLFRAVPESTRRPSLIHFAIIDSAMKLNDSGTQAHVLLLSADPYNNYGNTIRIRLDADNTYGNTIRLRVDACTSAPLAVGPTK